MTCKYLETKIVEAKRTDVPRYGMTAAGYTKRSGAPTQWMIRLRGEYRFRRLMCWQFSNAGTCFVRVKGECLIVRDCDMPPERLFDVVEYSSGFAVVHLPSGDEHWMSDGVDVLFDKDDKAISPGTPYFAMKWADALNETPDETMEAYFPQHVTD